MQLEVHHAKPFCNFSSDFQRCTHPAQPGQRAAGLHYGKNGGIDVCDEVGWIRGASVRDNAAEDPHERLRQHRVRRSVVAGDLPGNRDALDEIRDDSEEEHRKVRSKENRSDPAIIGVRRQWC